MDDHSSGTDVATGLVLPTRGSGLKRPCRRAARSPYSALLPVGLAMRALLPAPRWALTPPFHPYPGGPGRSVLCGAFRQVALPGRYPAPLLQGVRTFLPQKGAAIQPSALCWPRRWRDAGQSPCDRGTGCSSSFSKYAGGFGGLAPQSVGSATPIRNINEARKADAAIAKGRRWSRPGFPVWADGPHPPARPVAHGGSGPP